MSTTKDRIYQPSDLASTGRKQFVADALRDRARLRTSDGDALVMMRESRLEHIAAISDFAVAYLTVTTALRRPREDRRAADYGEWAFISAFDDEDIQEFLDEVNDAIVLAVSDQDHATLEELIEDWRTSARTLHDPVAREILDGRTSSEDWVDAEPIGQTAD